MMNYKKLFANGPDGTYGGRWDLDFFLTPTDKVVDLGGSTRTYPYSTDVIDKQDSEVDSQRYGAKLDIGNRRLWNGYAEEILPTISNKYFDFIYSSHTLEHTRDLPFVIQEISRTCKRGFIIIPHYYMDIWSNAIESGHRWLFSYDHKNNILKYRKRQPFEYFPNLCGIQPPALNWRNPLIQGHENDYNFRALWEIRFYWEDSIIAIEDPSISEESLYIKEKFLGDVRC